MNQGPRRGVLLLQLGTPDGVDVPAVRRYLREFLMDPRVIDLPAVPRWLLVHGIIAPFRAPRSAAAYRSIWTPEGSPLRVHGRALAAALAERLGLPVTLGMRYGSPSIPTALAELGDVDEIVVVPLYPQYASASTGSALAGALAAAGDRLAIPALHVTRPFVQHPGWSRVVADLARPAVEGADVVIFSYHGLPEAQVRATRAGCLESATCCDRPDAAVGFCYRAQCLATTRLLTAHLGLPRVATAFQSRLGRARWLTPGLEETIDRVVAEGARRITVITPAFVADCLETLEEVGIRARAHAQQRGATLTLAPCPNADPRWADVLAGIVRETAGLRDTP